ncbi:hypothetical protein BL253_27280 [Pseudofrankia asymbiotica]|uniref:Uncharacterized protein n=1 Tax=Pseudofrankia asymbiotica TaxID=1834516 RepID=A0A1V2I4E9_9ACTN|nr:hypothetical protein BL253_27280 [Pseudofrankia asymbiotica]
MSAGTGLAGSGAVPCWGGHPDPFQRRGDLGVVAALPRGDNDRQRLLALLAAAGDVVFDSL